MAKTGSFSYTNTTPSSSKTLPLFDMGETTNYGKKVRDTRADYLNTKASSTDAYERFSFFSSPIKTVPCGVEVVNPSKKRIAAKDENSRVIEGIKYGVIYDAINVETDNSDAAYIVDHPVRIELDIIHENVDTITVSQIKECLGRVYSVLEHADGTSRLSDLRGGIVEISGN
jgi:hypothetical protein